MPRPARAGRLLKALAIWGVHVAFHPAGTLLASNGCEGRLRLWDPILGRPLLNVTAAPTRVQRGRKDRRLLEDKLTIYEVDPALEYRTFAHPRAEPIHYRWADRPT